MEKSLTNSAADVLNTEAAPIEASPKQHISQWRTAAERADGIRTKKKQRRTAHRASLKRSHTKG